MNLFHLNFNPVGKFFKNIYNDVKNPLENLFKNKIPEESAVLN